MSYKVQQLGLNGVLDQAITLVKANFMPLFQIMLLTMIPWGVITGIVQFLTFPTLPANPTAEDVARFANGLSAAAPVTLGLFALGFVFVFPIANAAVIYCVAQIYLGKPVTPLAALQKALGKLGALIGTSILMTLAIMGGFILLIVPGVLCALWFGLAQHVVVLESLSGADALGRSKKLVRPYLGTFLGLGLVVGLSSGMVSACSAYVPQQQVQIIVSVLLNSILTIFSTAVFVIFYFSCRCGVENFDLEHLAAAVGESVQSPADLEPAV